MDTMEAFFLILSAVSTLTLIGLLMVSARALQCSDPLWRRGSCGLTPQCQVGLAWFMGARFDKIFSDPDAKVAGSTTSPLGSVPTLGHQEL